MGLSLQLSISPPKARIYWETLSTKYLNWTQTICQLKSCSPQGAGVQPPLLRLDSRDEPGVEADCSKGDVPADWDAVGRGVGQGRSHSNLLGLLGWNKPNWKGCLILMWTKHSRAARAATGRQWVRPELPPVSPSWIGREMEHQTHRHLTEPPPIKSAPCGSEWDFLWCFPVFNTLFL